MNNFAVRPSMIQVVTPRREKKDKNDPARLTEVVFLKKYHEYDLDKRSTPRPYRFGGTIKVELRPYNGSVVVHLNVNDVRNSRRYRALVRSLFGWSFGNLLNRRIQSHRRWGSGKDHLYVDSPQFGRIVDRVLARTLLRQPAVITAPAIEVLTEQLATT